jgi:hypothetical protein
MSEPVVTEFEIKNADIIFSVTPQHIQIMDFEPQAINVDTVQPLILVPVKYTSSPETVLLSSLFPKTN